MRYILSSTAFFALVLLITPAVGGEVTPISDATAECIDCHSSIHAGIVEGWRKSRHAAVSPAQALKVTGLARKVSNPDVPEQLRNSSVGCAECHTLRPDQHADTFEHNGYQIHTVVTPDDCRTCHLQEREQFSQNKMALAEKIITGNALYAKLQAAISGTPEIKADGLIFNPPDAGTRATTCLYCHGTRVTVAGSETRETMAGKLQFPVLKGWPNQGVGRLNPDGSRGTCSACHTRHRFSIAMARKPYTCEECHVGPDVPAYKVYASSKHGNIFAAMGREWNFTPVPWTVGEDFDAPTCAACHMSLLTNTDGEMVVARSHRVNDRLAWRLFGLVYAHPQPKAADTTIIRNKEVQPLPTALDGTPAAGFLIDSAQQQARRQVMGGICRNCHDQSWVKGHFALHDNTIARSNLAVKRGTEIMQDIWRKGLAKGFPQGANPYDEYIERRWNDLWLLDANAIRFSSAMAGGGDYSVFAQGYYNLSRGITLLDDWCRQHPPADAP